MPAGPTGPAVSAWTGAGGGRNRATAALTLGTDQIPDAIPGATHAGNAATYFAENAQAVD